MIAQDVQQAFERLWEPDVRLAVSPMLCLAGGVVLFLVADIFDFLKRLRGPIFIGAIVGALVFELALLLGMDAPPGSVLAGSLIADETTALWGCMFLVGSLLAWVYSIGYYRENLPFKPEHDALMLTAPVGMMLMVGAGDLITFFIGLELLSIPLYALAAFRRARTDSVEAGIKYFVLGTFAAALFLYGAALIYMATGTLSIADLADPANKDRLSTPMALAGLAFLGSGVFFKVAVFPFHFWVPDVYQGSPTPVTALMATGTKAAAFGFLIRVSDVLPQQAAGTIAVIALLTMLAGNLGALVQEDLKRMLAYSSVAHAGTLLLVVAAGIASGNQAAATNAALVYMAAYLFTATGAFGLIALLESDGDRFTKLDSLRGLSRSRPGVAAAMALFMLSLGGIPATGGFIDKWFVFAVLIDDAKMITVAVIGILLSVVALGYYLRVIVTIYMQPAGEQRAPTTKRPWTAGLATVICSAMVLALGVVPAWFLDRLPF
ncbi:MAG: NADH-quinone oxidoreductase subunit N [Planctomycetota bacterium]|nr:NADH-quinone oxidoreductase subunit N [Planctomycetota bacterium]